MKRFSAPVYSCGYILIETVMAMAVLSVGIVAVQSGVRQTLIVRGQARDYTQARFLLEQLIAEIDLQPMHVESSKSGRFEGEHSRFKWRWEISKLDIPEPEPPPAAPMDELPELPVKYIVKVTATVSWERGGREFEETVQTLLGPERLFLPEEMEDQTR